ncbi:unnamed protein product [Caenorhabditis nigoni]
MKAEIFEDPNPIPQIPNFAPSPFTVLNFPLFFQLSQVYAQNPNLLPMMLQYFQHVNFQNISALPFPFPLNIASNMNGSQNSGN